MEKQKRKRRLYRSMTDRRVAGVSGGLAAYFNLDPVLIRFLFVALTIFAGKGAILYLILWMIMPQEPEAEVII